MNKILSNKARSKTSAAKSISLNLDMGNGKKMLPIDPMWTTVSSIDVYNKERENCTLLRLNFSVNVVASNVLFNNITEIVRNEGSEDVEWFNLMKTNSQKSNVKRDKITLFKKNNTAIETTADAVKDTQLTSLKNNFVYHCGADIFNNHVLRSLTFKGSYPSGNNSDSFNTIGDGLRDVAYTSQKSGYTTVYGSEEVKLHSYLNEEILSFKECYKEKLKEENGWFGFVNQGKMPISVKDLENDQFYFKVINNKKQCDFIDLAPERDLFSFAPKYNSFRHRVEKNWNYCLTYPYSSTTSMSFIREMKDTETNEVSGYNLKIFTFDDSINNSNGTKGIKIWSISKHGLNVGDTINLYKGDVCALYNVEVISVDDDYVFYVNRGEKLADSSLWYNVEDLLQMAFPSNGNTYTWLNKGKSVQCSSNGVQCVLYATDDNKICLDPTCGDLSFTRTISGNECSYYVRMFTRVPNWKYSEEKPNEDNFDKLISDNQDIDNDFENHIGRMAFARNVYNDSIGEITYTDDVDIKLLKDNLGRPVTSLYLTLVKNNQGYKEWYGKGTDINISGDTIEYSHVFGKVTSAFKLSKISQLDVKHKSSLTTNNIDNNTALKTVDIRLNDTVENQEDDEVLIDDKVFYGDLCCYSPSTCAEQSIQMVDFRFNTAQRELTSSDGAYSFLKDIEDDEIVADDFDASDFKVSTTTISSLERKEGYYYKPHYEIPIRALNGTITSAYPRIMRVTSMIQDRNNEYKVLTYGYHFLGEGSILFVFDKSESKLLYGKVMEMISNKAVKVQFFDDEKLENNTAIDETNVERYKFFVKPQEIPSYATFMLDGSCRYIWRTIYENGFSPNDDVEEYPFTNGALYISQNINVYVHRQDPTCTNTILSTMNFPTPIAQPTLSFEQENNYYLEDDITC